MCWLLVLGREERTPRSGRALRSGGIDAPSSESSHQAGPLQMSQLAKRRNRPSHSSLQVLFHTLYLVPQIGPRNVALRRTWLGNQSGPGQILFYSYKGMFIMHHKCSFPLSSLVPDLRKMSLRNRRFLN